MPPNASALPDSRTLYGLLERITETLAREIARPGTPQPNWQATEWSLARAVAVMQGISSLLSTQGFWAGDRDWRPFLENQQRNTTLRHTRLVTTAAQIDANAREAGICLVALKGMELHRLGLYQAGERPMADIDLLVEDRDYTRTVALLERLGFAGGIEGWKDHPFVAGPGIQMPVLGEHQANPVKVELHRRIVERLPWEVVALPVGVRPRDAQHGLNPYRSNAALMVHLLLHAAGEMPTRTLRMIQLCDLARLARHLRDAEWDEIRQSEAWWAYPPLALTARYFPDVVPAEVIDDFRGRCPGSLVIRAQQTRLFDASHSYPWVEAFPGIAWSRTWRERAAYMANRIKPSRQVRAKRRTLATTEAWSDRDWSQRSQWRRVLRYLSGPQARPSTMYAVRLALGSSG